MVLHQRVQLAHHFLLLALLFVYLHLCQSELLAGTFSGLNALEGLYHLGIVVLRSVETVEQLQHICAVAVVAVELFVGVDGLVILPLGDVVLPQTLLIGVVVGCQLGRLHEAHSRYRVVLQVGVVARKLEIHLRCIGAQLAGIP